MGASGGKPGQGVKRLVSRVVLLGLTGSVLGAAPAMATTFVPTTTADGNNGSCTPTLCTLRDAVIAAGASAGNTVSLTAGTYTLSLGELGIVKDMAITGAGTRTTIIDAQGTSRVFHEDQGISVAMRDLTITGGFAGLGSNFPSMDGGGIANEGDLALQRVAIVGNRALLGGGGIDAPFEGSGPLPSMAIEDSLIANNTVSGGAGNGQGGGAAIFGNTAIRNTTIANNQVGNPGTNEGGGLVVARDLGSSVPASLALLNTTIANNSISGGSPGSFGGGLSGDNLGGPTIFSELAAQNTIIAGNTVNGSAQDCGLVNTSATTHNLSGDATCGFTDAGSKQNTNPQLGALGNNGGPTNTMLPADTSPAKNTGDNNGCPSADQRGISRPQAVVCDIGAVELKPPDLQIAQSATGGKAQTTTLASAAKRKQKKLSFLVTVTNRGEQSPRGARLAVTLSGKIRKLGISGGCTVTLKKKKKKGKKRQVRKVRMVSCPLANLAPGASTSVTLSLKPRKRRGKVVSAATVTNDLGEGSSSGHSATTALRFKQKKNRHRH